MQRILVCDLHCHLLEKKTSPHKWWLEVKRKKLDVVAITEHFNCNPKKAYSKLLSLKPKNVLLLPGMELETSAGHVLVYGLDSGVFNVKEFFLEGIDFFKVVELAMEKKLLVVVCHPWGLSHDSAAYFLGESMLRHAVSTKRIGVEVYNGLVGKASDFVYYSEWVRKPLNFFNFLERNFVSKKLRLNRLGMKLGKGLSKKMAEVLEKNVKAFELGKKAAFITAGSDGHSADAIGTGIIKVKFNENVELNAENFWNALMDKRNIVWAGPYVREIGPNQFVVDHQTVKKMELLQGLRYAASKTVKKSVNEKIVKKISKKSLVERIKHFGKKLKGKSD